MHGGEQLSERQKKNRRLNMNRQNLKQASTNPRNTSVTTKPNKEKKKNVQKTVTVSRKIQKPMEN